MADRTYPDGCAEISGFGGGYEKACREMVLAGMVWLDENPEADPQFHGYKNVFGIVSEDNEDAEALSAAVVAACEGCTGAMHQAVIGHVLYAHRVGWDAYIAKMQEPDPSEDHLMTSPTDTREWIACKDKLPATGLVVETKVDDEGGARNESRLMRQGRLWFFPDGSMYVYYTPTHWRPVS